MKLLLDTHIFLWLLSGDNSLAATALAAIRDPSNEVYLSVVSLWEIIIRNKLGKLPLPGPPEVYITAQRQRYHIASLAVDEASVAQIAQLPPLHRDPFDRLLIGQAIEHGLTLVTLDAAIRAYPMAPILQG